MGDSALPLAEPHQAATETTQGNLLHVGSRQGSGAAGRCGPGAGFKENARGASCGRDSRETDAEVVPGHRLRTREGMKTLSICPAPLVGYRDFKRVGVRTKARR